MEGLSRGKPGKRAAITGKGKEEVGKKQEQEGRGEKKKQTEFTFDVVTCTIQDKEEVEAKNLEERKEQQGDRICERDDEDYIGEPAGV